MRARLIVTLDLLIEIFHWRESIVEGVHHGSIYRVFYSRFGLNVQAQSIWNSTNPRGALTQNNPELTHSARSNKLTAYARSTSPFALPGESMPAGMGREASI
jgi:hypothetical protein